MVLAMVKMPHTKKSQTMVPVEFNELPSLRFSHSTFSDIITGLTPTENRPVTLADSSEWKDYSNINNVDTPTLTLEITSFIDSINQNRSYELLTSSCSDSYQLSNADSIAKTPCNTSQSNDYRCFDVSCLPNISYRNPPKTSIELSKVSSSISRYCQSLTGTSTPIVNNIDPELPLHDSYKNMFSSSKMELEDHNSYESPYENSMYSTSNSFHCPSIIKPDEDTNSSNSSSHVSAFSHAIIKKNNVPDTYQHQVYEQNTDKTVKISRQKNFRNGHTYMGEKPHECDQPGCGKRFARVDELRRHKRTHNNFKPYFCDQCDKRFTRSDHLTTHKRTHTGEKPYKCEKCTKCFARSDERYRHMKTHDKPRRCGRKPKQLVEQVLVNTYEAKLEQAGSSFSYGNFDQV